MRKRIYVMTAALLCVWFITGCGVLDTMLQKDGNTKGSIGDWIGKGTAAPTLQTSVLPSDGKTVTLFFGDTTGKYLVKEERTIPKTLSLARETINQWLKGPAVVSKGSGSQAVVSPTTALLDIAVKDGVATVDLSKEFNQPYGKITPELKLYGLVNTLSQFPTVREVHLRVEGKPLSKLGNIDATKLSYKASLVKATALKTPSGSTNPGAVKDGLTPPASPSSINLFAFPVRST
ncbi:MAG: GerMN domain-containing protein [Desulfitobacteriaceae bacterium]